MCSLSASAVNFSFRCRLLKSSRFICMLVCLETNICRMSPNISAVVYNFAFVKPSFRCIICLHQPPSLRGLASRAVLHLTFNIDQFKFTREITYDQFAYIASSNDFLLNRLITVTYLTLKCQFTKETMKTKVSLLLHRSHYVRSWNVVRKLI